MPNSFYDPAPVINILGTSGTKFLLANLIDAGAVFADDAMTQPLTVYVGAAGTPKTTLSTGPYGFSEQFSTDEAYKEVYVQWPLPEGGVMAQRIVSEDYADAYANLGAAVTSAATAASAAETASEAARAAANMIANSTIGQVLDTDGFFKTELFRPGALTGTVETGTDATGNYIDPTPGDTADRIYFVPPSALTTAIQAAGVESAQPGSIAKRDNNGRMQAANPVAQADVMTRGYFESNIPAAVNTAMVAAMKATPDVAYYDGTKYVLGVGGPALAPANRSSGRPMIFFGDVDPATVGTGTNAIWRTGDLWYKVTA